MKKTTKVCVNNAGAFFTFIPVEVTKKLKLKAGEKLDWEVVKGIVKLKKNPEVEREPQEWKEGEEDER